MISAIRIICNLIFVLISIMLCLSFFLVTEQNRDDFTDFDDFEQITKKNQNYSKNILKPNICTSPIYGIPVYLYIPFINDAYYYDENDSKKSSSFHHEKYKNIFFENYDIDVVGNLIVNEKKKKKLK